MNLSFFVIGIVALLVMPISSYSDSPLKQEKSGVLPNDIKCKESLVKIYKFENTAICVKLDTAKKLIDREFARDLIKYTQIEIVKEDVKLDYTENIASNSNLMVINYVVYDDVLPHYVVDIAFKKWSDVNPQFSFVNDNQTDSLKIKPIPTGHDSYFEDRNSLLMGFYDSETNTIYMSDGENPTVSINTLTHEFGHYLNLVHSCQKNSPFNVMFSKLDKECVEDEFYDTLGYVLPTNNHRLYAEK